MSIPLLIETQSEVRRLLIAGSELAVGDFRLKKLLPPMRKAGEGVPVFARVADALEKVIEPGSEKVAEKLLELANLVNAILYTQGQTGMEGVLSDIDSAGLELPTDVSYRRLKPVIEALTSKGSGRLEIIKEAYHEGIYKDLRLMDPLLYALEDNFPEIGQWVSEILGEFGLSIIPVLKENFDFQGGKGYARRIELISKLAGRSEKEFILRAVEEGSSEVKISAIKALKDFPECESVLLILSRDRKKEVREAGLFALASLESESAAQRLFEVFNSKERDSAAFPIKTSSSKSVAKMLLEEAEKVLEVILRSEKHFSLFAKKVEPPSDDVIQAFNYILDCMEGKKDPEIFEFLKKCLEHTKHLQQFKVIKPQGFIADNTLARMVANNLVAFQTREAYELLDSIRGKFDHCLLSYSFLAAMRTQDPANVFDHYAGYVKQGKKANECQQVLGVMGSYVDYKSLNLADAYRQENGNPYEAETSRELIQWDPRWLKVLMDIDELAFVCKLASKDHPGCVSYLLEKLKENKNFNYRYLSDIIMGLLQAQYPKIMEVIRDVIEHNVGTGHNMGHFYSFIRVLQLLPPEYAPELERIAHTYNSQVASRLLEIAQSIKMK